MADTSLRWQPQLAHDEGPLYALIADAIERDIHNGRLQPGDVLPPQRQLAQMLAVHFTTVTHAYAEAKSRKLVGTRAGSGTYILPGQQAEAAIVDLSFNRPPEPPDLGACLAQALDAVRSHADLADLLRYQTPIGSETDRMAGVQWLKQRLPAVRLDQVIITAGTQNALFILLSSLVGSGESLFVEALTYPGIKTIASLLRIHLESIALDEEGILPDAFAQACQTSRAKTLYCVPTIQNPTTAIMSVERRQAIAAIARTYDITIIEDDAYGRLPPVAPPPLATFAPERTYFTAGLAKCLAPGLRIAYMVVPDGTLYQARFAAAIRATTWMASPLAAAVTTQWVTSGVAHHILNEIRLEASARQKLAHRILVRGDIQSQPEAHHLWLKLPQQWSRAEFVTQARQRGVLVGISDSFSCAPSVPEAVRLCLGAPATQSQLQGALESLADLLKALPDQHNMLV